LSKPADLVCIAECPEFGVIMCLGKASWVVWHAVCVVALSCLVG
jgi:hypothetical protein